VIRARYAAALHETKQRYTEREINGAPEIRRATDSKPPHTSTLVLKQGKTEQTLAQYVRVRPIAVIEV
jgi:hypothetical protein